MANLKIQYWATSRLKHFAGNARLHDEQNVSEIAKSIQRFGFVNPVLADKDGEIIAGHGRAMAAAKLQIEQVPVIVLSGLSEDEKRALRLADNRIAEKSRWDSDLLSSELRSLRDLNVDIEGLGWSDGELDRMLQETLDALPADPFEQKPSASKADEQDDEDELDELDAPAASLEQPKQETPKAAEPKASDDEFSVFELIMNHENKIRLVECLSRIRADQLYDKLEDALMHLVKHYEGDPVG